MRKLSRRESSALIKILFDQIILNKNSVLSYQF